MPISSKDMRIAYPPAYFYRALAALGSLTLGYALYSYPFVAGPALAIALAILQIAFRKRIVPLWERLGRSLRAHLIMFQVLIGNDRLPKAEINRLRDWLMDQGIAQPDGSLTLAKIRFVRRTLLKNGVSSTVTHYAKFNASHWIRINRKHQIKGEAWLLTVLYNNLAGLNPLDDPAHYRSFVAENHCNGEQLKDGDFIEYLMDDVVITSCRIGDRSTERVSMQTLTNRFASLSVAA